MTHMPQHVNHPSQRAKLWTPEEDRRLRALWRTAPTDELLAAFPGRSAEQLMARARRFALTAKDRPTGAAPMDKH